MSRKDLLKLIIGNGKGIKVIKTIDGNGQCRTTYPNYWINSGTKFLTLKKVSKEKKGRGNY
jgi:hypothetical protein